MTSHLRHAFPRVVAVVYTGGTVAHVLRLYLGFTWRDMPFWIDWVLVALGTVGVAGLVRFHREVRYRGLWERVAHWAIVVHLGVSVVVHVQILVVGSHRILAPFPAGYSWFALAYFGFFAWRSWTMRLREE